MNNRPTIINGVLVPYDASIEDLSMIVATNHQQLLPAIIALAHIPGQESLRLLGKYLKDKDPYLRRAALEGLPYHPQNRNLEKDIILCFNDQSEYVVRTACDTAAILSLSSAHEPIMRLLTSSSPSTREVSARALASLWLPTDMAPLIASFKEEKNERVRRQLAWTMREHVTGDNWRTVFSLFVADRVARHRKWACEIANEFNPSLVRNDLERLASDPDGHVRKAAKLGLKV
jgi:HEAT repeat protein